MLFELYVQLLGFLLLLFCEIVAAFYRFIGSRDLSGIILKNIAFDINLLRRSVIEFYWIILVRVGLILRALFVMNFKINFNLLFEIFGLIFHVFFS